MKHTAHKVLLSEDLRKKVEDKMRECYAIAAKHYKLSFEFPEVRYDITSWTGGLAYFKRNLIRFNLILLVENEEEYIATTVPHEVAHLIAYKVWENDKTPNKKRMMPHGKIWKDVMAVLNTPPRVTHNYDVSSIQRRGYRRSLTPHVNRADRVIRMMSRLDSTELLKIKSEIDRLIYGYSPN